MGLAVEGDAIRFLPPLEFDCCAEAFAALAIPFALAIVSTAAEIYAESWVANASMR
jgi:hypothetical protein